MAVLTETTERLEETVAEACDGLNGCDGRVLLKEAKRQMNDHMSEKDMKQLLIRTACEKTSVEEPNWQFVAARLHLDVLYQEAAENRGYGMPGYGSFYDLIVHLTKMDRYGEYILEHYSEAEIGELESYMKPERDKLFHYLGTKTLSDRYLIKGLAGETLELLQELFMGVAMHLAMYETAKLSWAKQFYDVLSKLEMTVATPTLNTARKPDPQLSSCFIDTVDDDLWSIYNVNQSFAQISKRGGGQGIYIGKIRSRGSDIRGFQDVAGGVIPWVKNYNNTALAVDQLGVRRGAAAIYLDAWHADILDFLNLKTNNGDDRMKAHDIFPAVCIPDVFMEVVKERGTWFLFDPHEIRKKKGYSLEDFYGEAFRKRFWDCVDDPEVKKSEIPAIDIMKRLLASCFETGTPFLFFRDTVNQANPNKHRGMIYSSNLCTEICQNMSPTRLVETQNKGDRITTTLESGDFVVCNLSSLNLGRVHTKEDIERVVTCQVRMMDNVIDLNEYPVKQAEITNKKYRALGLGTSGYHQMLAQSGIVWESEEHLEKADEIYEWINYCAVKASAELAEEKGAYPYFENSEWQTGKYFQSRGYENEKWTELRNKIRDHGVRNAYLFAIAPTSSTSLIAGSTAGIDPVFRKFFIEEKKNALIPQTAPNLNEKTTWYYKEAHQIDQHWSIKAAGVRQRHVDQSQSFNLYITPQITAKEMLGLIVSAWENGLKTVYYVRNQSLELDDCVSCSS
ncbi:MAG TPA: ribonucleoside-diphosphate reductase subunit alpha [Bacillales bacterium]|nr:ribonucleoside-diphosphate reductase subunit alpha [Bacillales bacterium]